MFLFMYSYFHINSFSHVSKILVIVSGKIKINYKKKTIFISKVDKSSHNIINDPSPIAFLFSMLCNNRNWCHDQN